MLAPLATGFLRHELDPIWGGKFPFTTFYPAVALAAWLGGLGPGLLASALATGGALFFFPSFAIPGPDRSANLIALTLFASVNVFISVLSEALHRARRRAEVTRDTLRASEARLRGIVTSAKDAIITIDAEQRILLFNAGAEAVFGYAANETIGRPLDRLIPDRFRDLHRRHVDGFGTSGFTMRAMGSERTLAGVRRSGEEFPMEAHISQVEVEGRKLYTVILRDITERKKAEAEREHLLALAERERGAAEAALETVGRMQSITEAALVDLPFDQLLHELVNRVREALEGDTG